MLHAHNNHLHDDRLTPFLLLLMIVIAVCAGMALSWGQSMLK